MNRNVVHTFEELKFCAKYCSLVRVDLIAVFPDFNVTHRYA